MDDRIQWIEKDSALTPVVSEMVRGPIALDTEADSFHHYREKVCLIQLSFDQRDILLDPLAGLRVDLLRPVLENPGIRKVLHGADYDLRILHRDFGLEVRGLFDTMVAARLVGERDFGLASLLKTYQGVHLQKKYQLADWSRRPLSRQMMEYAASDTRYLLGLSEMLEEKLERLGRMEWSREEFLRLESVRWSGEVEDPEAFRKVKGSSSLDQRGLAILREIYSWRDSLARERDIPAFRVASDGALVTLARQAPRTAREMSRTPGLPARLVRGPMVPEVLRRIGRALARPASDWPERRKRARRRAESEHGEALRAMRGRRDALARELDLEPSLLASRGLLESIVSRLERGKDWRTIPDLRSWQAELIKPLLPRAV